jgi:hypothetical protein
MAVWGAIAIELDLLEALQQKRQLIEPKLRKETATAEATR